MKTYREIVYYCLDAIKSNSGDSDITEEHVIFLADQYRLFLLEQKKKKEGADSLSSSNQQTICLSLNPVSSIPDLQYCADLYLKSDEVVPDLLDSENVSIYTYSYFNIMVSLVSKDRFKYVGSNKYMKNIIYGTIGDDHHLYLKSNNPQFKYIREAKLTGIFEDSQKAAKLTCSTDASVNTCNILDQEFPLEADLVSQMLELIVKELLGVSYRPVDSYNNSQDDLSDLVAFLRKNMKSNFQKQIE